MYRSWAFWRRVQYATGAALFALCVGIGVYILFIYQAPTCFDGLKNGMERGVDCGGSCRLVCSADVEVPVVRWSRSFKISDGAYNTVAYIENHNRTVGTKKLAYTFRLVDDKGDTIVEKAGTTFLPPDGVYPIFEGHVLTGARIPTQTFITLAPIAEWEVFSSTRDQFTVNSRTLVGVDSRPRLDASLTNTALTDAHDVEIVATIFNSAGTALTASRTIVPLFENRMEKKVTFTWPEPIAKTLRSCEVPTDVVLAIDLSGSMDNDGGTPPEPVSSALRSAASFIGRLGAQDQVSVVTFASKGLMAHSLTKDKAAVTALVQGLSIDPKEERGGTDTGDAIALGAAELQSDHHNKDARKILIVFTDGKANLPDPDPEGYALAAVKKAKDADITVFTIGLGTDLNQAFLSAVASSPGNRYLAPDKNQLDTVYRSISTAICEEGPAVIDIIPKVIGSLNTTTQ